MLHLCERKNRYVCATCNKEGKQNNKLCSKCSVAAYCCKECQQQDWPRHKRYCKHFAFYKDSSGTQDYGELKMKADAEHSEVFQAAVAAAKAAPEGRTEGVVLMTPVAANKFIEALVLDQMPSSETEDRMWGLWGGPAGHSQRVYSAYQKAFKYGDLSATKLMEALLARPHASRALTDLLQNTKIVCTETDSLESSMRVVDMYRALVEGLTVNSELDQWPLRREGAAAAAGAGAAAGPSSKTASGRR